MSKERLVNPEQNIRVLARLEGVGPNTVTAFSSAYDHEFPSALDGIVSRKEFRFCMEVIDQTVEDYYPCLPRYACGYFCCFTTLGLSLLFPEPCTKQVGAFDGAWVSSSVVAVRLTIGPRLFAYVQLETNLEIVLKRLNNREELLYRDLIWKFRRDKRSRTSWLEICQIICE